jgi:hypothetical protein
LDACGQLRPVNPGADSKFPAKCPQEIRDIAESALQRDIEYFRPRRPQPQSSPSQPHPQQILMRRGPGQIFANPGGGTKVVWIADLLPDSAAPAVSAMMEQGIQAMKNNSTRVLNRSANDRAQSIPPGFA